MRLLEQTFMVFEVQYVLSFQTSDELPEKFHCIFEKWRSPSPDILSDIFKNVFRSTVHRHFLYIWKNQQIQMFFFQKLYNFQIFFRLSILTDILLQVGNTPHLGLFVATVTRIVNDQQKSRIQGSQSGNGLILIRIISLHILVFLYLESFRASWPRYHVV